MSEMLTPKQTLLLWCLLARQGVAEQKSIEPEVRAPDRLALERKRLVSSFGRPLVIKLEDEGWAWAAAHLSDPLPKNYGALRDFLVLLRRHLDEAGEDLGGFIGTPPVAEVEAPKGKKGTSKGSGKTSGGKKGGTRPPTGRGEANAKGPAPPAPLRTRIETAYLAVTGGKTNVDARLADVRRHLAPPMDRAAVDAELRAMQAEGKARLMRQDDQRALTSADEDAALRHAGEAFHILWILR